MPLVSIVTATCNHGEFIEDCVRSVKQQTFSDWEQIIVDDGSTDATVERACNGIGSDSRVKVIRQERKGIYRLAETYNRGLAAAEGKYIAILEGDDVWPVDKLEVQVAAMEAYPHTVLSFGYFERLDASGRVLFSRATGTRKLQLEVIPRRDALKGFLVGGLTVMPVTALITVAALREIGGFQQPRYYPAVEHPTFVNLAAHGDFLMIPRILGSWRRHVGQTSDMRGVRLSAGVARYNSEFFELLGGEVRSQLGISAGALKVKRRRALARAFFAQGRRAAVRRRRDRAKRNFEVSFRLGDLIIRAKAGIALASLYVGLNPEIIIRLLGGTRYK